MEWLNDSWLVFGASVVVVALMMWKVHRDHSNQDGDWFNEEDIYNNDLDA